MDPHSVKSPKATIAVFTVFAALTTTSAAENLASSEITLEEAKTLDPPVATDRCPYVLLRAWIDVPDTASTLVGWYRANKRNADVWEDPPYDRQPIDEPALAAAQARLRRKHHMSDDLVKRSRDLPSWEPDCVKPTH